MAHENLKFSLDFSDNQNWQPIVGNQDYGTFYMIYIKIKNYGSQVNEFGVTEYFYDCDFRIQNFRGEITIGFSGIPQINPKDSETIINSNEKIDVEIILQLAPFTFNEFCSRNLKREMPIKNNSILRTTVERHLPANDLYNRNEPLKSAYIDPYRYVRDGDTVLEIGTRSYQSNENFNSLADPGIGGDPSVGICAPDLSKIKHVS